MKTPALCPSQGVWKPLMAYRRSLSYVTGREPFTRTFRGRRGAQKLPFSPYLAQHIAVVMKLASPYHYRCCCCLHAALLHLLPCFCLSFFIFFFFCLCNRRATFNFSIPVLDSYVTTNERGACLAFSKPLQDQPHPRSGDELPVK